MPTPLQLITIAGISALGGAVNSIAGGGMLLVFPALVGLGVPPIVANATGTVALWPGSMSSLWGYRGAMRGARKWAIDLAVPSLVGGLLGAWLLLSTPSARFAQLVPWLVFGGTILFLAQRPLSNWLMRRSRAARSEGEGVVIAPSIPRTAPPIQFLLLQLAISIYGGYFGAGAGILMLFGLGKVPAILATIIYCLPPMIRLTALGIAQRSVSNTHMGGAIAKVTAGLKEGGGLSGPLAASGVFPPMALSFLRTGEETARLGLMLTRLADVLDRAVRSPIERLIGIITPAITVAMGAVVAAVIASIMSAILGFNDLALAP